MFTKETKHRFDIKNIETKHWSSYLNKPTWQMGYYGIPNAYQRNVISVRIYWATYTDNRMVGFNY